MYFAMDDFGFENLETLKNMQSEMEKWNFICKVAAETGFDGIQITGSVYEKSLNLSLGKIPSCVKKYRLTYHMGGINELSDDEEIDVFNNAVSKSLRIAVENQMEDVSLHPPYLSKEKHYMRKNVRDNFNNILEKWLPKFEKENITLSVETHVSGEYFVFQGLEDYVDFVKDFSGLGVLIDVSHNFYDGYSEDDMYNFLNGFKITGLHLSDAISGIEFRAGTHLPVGKGNIDFNKLLKSYIANDNIYGGLEILANYADLKCSLDKLKNIGV